jgi:hypothetical protein
LQGAPYIYDVSRLRVKKRQENVTHRDLSEKSRQQTGC